MGFVFPQCWEVVTKSVPGNVVKFNFLRKLSYLSSEYYEEKT